VVVVLVDPCWQSGEPGGFGVVELLEGPALGEGSMEPLDLAVGLPPVEAGLLRGDAQLQPGVAPQVGLVAAAVVGETPLDGHATVGEPGDCVAQHLGRSLLGLVVVSLDVGHPGVVIDHGVQVAGPDDRMVALGARGSGPGHGG